MPTLNVRLREEDARLVRELKASGVSISDVVRAAVRREAEQLRAPRDLDVTALLAEMKAIQPAPSTRRTRPRVDTTDRRAVARHIRGRLRGA
jgi:Arc/MetJ-type ribon-helix-helix transcriptional regulator